MDSVKIGFSLPLQQLDLFFEFRGTNGVERVLIAFEIPI
jgi:hypothetical protein